MSDRRDFIGYGAHEPTLRWPNGARLAVSVVVNVEEGAELSLADGDERNESVYEAREEVVGAPDPCLESHYAYGPRAGYRRIAKVLDEARILATFSTCGRAAIRSPWLIHDATRRGHEISCHGWRWERHAGLAPDDEKSLIARTHAAIGAITGVPPVGWHTRSASTPHTRALLVEHGGFLYDSDAYDDDVPYLVGVLGRDHVVLPYAFDTNDMRFQPGGGFVRSSDFVEYGIDSFDRLWRESHSVTRMMSIGVHLRIIGRPGRIGALERLLAAMREREKVWFAPRVEIARYWKAHAPRIG